MLSFIGYTLGEPESIAFRSAKLRVFPVFFARGAFASDPYRLVSSQLQNTALAEWLHTDLIDPHLLLM